MWASWRRTTQTKWTMMGKHSRENRALFLLGGVQVNPAMHGMWTLSLVLVCACLIRHARSSNQPRARRSFDCNSADSTQPTRHGKLGSCHSCEDHHKNCGVQTKEGWFSLVGLRVCRHTNENWSFYGICVDWLTTGGQHTISCGAIISFTCIRDTIYLTFGTCKFNAVCITIHLMTRKSDELVDWMLCPAACGNQNRTEEKS